MLPLSTEYNEGTEGSHINPNFLMAWQLSLHHVGIEAGVSLQRE